MLTLLLACTGPEPEDSGDTSTDSGTDTEIQIEADVGILVDGDTAGLSVGLVHLTFGDEGLIVGGSLLTADAAAEVLVEAGTPDDADFFYPDGDTDPALELAVYAPVLFADDNGQGILEFLAPMDVHHAGTERAAPHTHVEPARPGPGSGDGGW